MTQYSRTVQTEDKPLDQQLTVTPIGLKLCFVDLTSNGHVRRRIMPKSRMALILRNSRQWRRA